MNLFASFAANNTLWLCVYELVMKDPITMTDSPVWCRALNVLLQYVLVTNYMWMLCEGIYLHTVLVNAFVSERKLLRALLALGWLFPVVPLAVYVGRRVMDNDIMCWMDFDKERLHPELAALVLSAILLNLANLINIVRVLWTKLRAGGALGAGAARPSATALHTLRATCLLAPLLGLQYLLLLIRPEPSGRWWRTYEFASALLISPQGLCVAVLYCFCNGEVLAQLRRRWRVLTFRPRANSATATTVSVGTRRAARAQLSARPERARLLQFVRSAAGAEDKV